VKAKRIGGAAKPDEVYEEIVTYVRQCGFAPTIDELTHILECGRSTVQRGIAALVADGRLVRRPRAPRAIQIAEKAQ
jgi:DNA-binding GntR family transcriptional regulator